MSHDNTPTLAEQSRSIRQHLRVRREHLATVLEPTGTVSPAYPRSMTMRLLVRHPALVVEIASLILGAAGGRRLRTVLDFVRIMRRSAPTAPDRALAPPRSDASPCFDRVKQPRKRDAV